MIEGLVNTVLGKLADEAFKKFTKIREVGEKVNKLKRELGRLQAFLVDADRKKIKDERQMHWVKELINVAYDIEDVIDNALLSQVNPQENTSKTKAFLSKLKKPLKLPALSKLSEQIDEILARIDEISHSREKYGINNLGEGSGEETMLSLKPILIPDFDDPNVVGFDSHKESIIKELLDQNNQSRSVVSIVGIGGLGKTTLARKVYNSIDVKTNFERHMWVVVSQNFQLNDILRKILEQIRPIDPSEQGKETEYFLTQLHKSLGREKYLLVLDDVWNAELWERIEEALVDANNGSRVLITSRGKNVAKAANPSVDPYQLPFLSEEQGLQLLLKKAHYNPDLTNNANSHDLLDIARKLVQKCGKLPLALVVLGGLLSRNRPETIVWRNFLQTMSWSADGSRCTNILATSYDDLQLAQKFCFMYFAAFPEDYEIDAKMLIRMWVAEGFIPQEKNRTLEDTAHRFLNDLVQRSMVQQHYRQTTDDYFITIHDLLRDLAIEKAKEMNFLTVVCSEEDEEQSCHDARRVAVHCSNYDGLVKYASPNLRSLLCFNSQPPNCSEYKLLKVLSDMRTDWTRNETSPILSSEGLTQLRYIKLPCDWPHKMNARFIKLINNMKFLQTLNPSTSVIGDPSDFIWDRETLRHVILSAAPPHTLELPSGCNLKNLQTLIGVKSKESWKMATLPNVPNLRILHITITKEVSWKVGVLFLRTLKNLVDLDLTSDNIPLDVFDMRGFSFYHHLTSLTLDGEFYHDKGVTIDAAMFPIHLSKLSLWRCGIHQDLMVVLEKLYNLKHLSLNSTMNECIKKIRCSTRGFPKLQYLTLNSENDLEEWEIEEGAMPMLQVLNVGSCHLLQVPLGLRYLTKLETLKWDLPVDQSETEIRNLCPHVQQFDVGLRLERGNRSRFLQGTRIITYSGIFFIPTVQSDSNDSD